jgi:DNA primase catalytic core
MITEERIQEAKSKDLPNLFRNRNIQLIPTNNGSSYKTCCPFHEEKEPSLNINLKEGVWLWNCFGCGEGGTAIDFVMKIDRVDFKNAVNILAIESQRHREIELNSTFKTQDTKLNRNELLRLIVNHYHKILINEDNKGRAYLEKRGLLDEELIKTFQLGFSNNNANTVFKEYRTQLREELGIFKVNYHESFANSVIFPVLDEKNNPTDLYARRVMNYTDRASHCYNKGKHQGVFNIKNVINAESIILTEGIIDALSIYKAGHKNVTALYGTNGFTKAHEELFFNGKVKEIIFSLDNDLAGERAVEKLKEKLKHLTLKKIQLPESIKDINELLVKQGKEAVLKAITEAELLKVPAKNKEQKINPENQCLTTSKFTYTNNDLIYTSQQIQYTIRNVLKLKNLESLRFILTVSLPLNQVTNKPTNQIYTDRIDLYLSRSRKGFESAVSKAFNLQPALIENDLLEITRFIEQDFNVRQTANETSTQKIDLAESEKTESLNFLKSKDLIKEIVKDITLLGYVGEEANKLLLYLCATSRKLEKPISVLIRSQSSTGKSYLIDKICDLLPIEDVHKWTSLTPKALYYMAEDALKHKFIAIDEREGMEEAEYPIRSLQSGSRLSLAVPIKNPTTGQTTTEQIIKEGPISYVDGSTDTRVNPENANRCFEIYLDESQEQTKRVQYQQKISHSLQGWKIDTLKDTIKRKHQNAQRLLEPIKVIIPYIELLDFPSDWIRTRRDHDRFLSLIICITFLHQYQREHKTYKGKAYIESTLKDYELAYKVASVVIFNTFQELEKPLFDFYLKLQLMVTEKSKEQGIEKDKFWFTRKDVRQFTKLPDYLVNRFMKRLTNLEYFQIKGGINGSRHFYKLSQTINKKKILEGLTKPEDLHHRIKAKNEEKKQDD